MLLTVIKKGTIITVKLVNGEELICSYEDDNDKVLKVGKPITVIPTQNAMSMAPYMSSSMPDIVELNRNLVVTFVPTYKAIADKYLEQMSGIHLS